MLFINAISNITVNGAFTKLYADDLKPYTSLTSLDDCHIYQLFYPICLTGLMIGS